MPDFHLCYHPGSSCPERGTNGIAGNSALRPSDVCPAAFSWLSGLHFSAMFKAVHVPHLNKMPDVFDIPMVSRYFPNISMMHCLMSVSPWPFSCRAYLETHHDMMP